MQFYGMHRIFLSVLSLSLAVLRSCHSWIESSAPSVAKISVGGLITHLIRCLYGSANAQILNMLNQGKASEPSPMPAEVSLMLSNLGLEL